MAGIERLAHPPNGCWIEAEVYWCVQNRKAVVYLAQISSAGDSRLISVGATKGRMDNLQAFQWD